MVQTIVTPQKTNLDLSVLLPDNYVGKQVHVLFYTDDEMSNTKASVGPKKKPSDYFGTLNWPSSTAILQASLNNVFSSSLYTIIWLSSLMNVYRRLA